MSDDPVVVRQTQREILDLQIPARFDPLQSVRTKLMFANMDMAFFQATGNEISQLVLMKMTLTMEEINQQQIEDEFDQQNPSADQLEDATTETRTYTVDGKDIQVTFSHGKLRAGKNAPAEHVGKDWFAVSSMMSAPGGMVMFSVTGPEGEFDEEEIENMIESIRFPGDD
jgi:hypothetical protein